MSNLDNETVGSIVAQNWKTASVFQKFNIDFCCKGGIAFGEACKSANLDPAVVAAEIGQIGDEKTTPESDYNAWPLDLMAEYIEKKHHKYVSDRLPELMAYLNKICTVHGIRHPELFEIRDLFSQSAGELTAHMKKEEFMVFPFIKKMVKAERENLRVNAPSYGTIQNPIEVMMHDHSDEGARFQRIAELSNGYNPPADGCSTYRVSFAMLQEFEQDLHKHIHLENNILFPKAITLERALARASN